MFPNAATTQEILQFPSPALQENEYSDKANQMNVFVYLYIYKLYLYYAIVC